MNRQPGFTRAGGPRTLRLGASFLFVLPLLTTAARGDEPAAGQPAARQLGLEECIGLGQESQPAIAAAQSSYGAALAGQRGVDNLRFAGLLSHDIAVRRQQACWGVNIAAAGVQLAELETRYSVIRMYFTV